MTRDEWLEMQLAKGVSVDALAALQIGPVPCDGDCDYADCPGWVWGDLDESAHGRG